MSMNIEILNIYKLHLTFLEEKNSKLKKTRNLEMWGYPSMYSQQMVVWTCAYCVLWEVTTLGEVSILLKGHNSSKKS